VPREASARAVQAQPQAVPPAGQGEEEAKRPAAEGQAGQQVLGVRPRQEALGKKMDRLAWAAQQALAVQPDERNQRVQPGPAQVSGQTFPRMHEGRPGWTIDPGYNMISSSYGGISSLVPSPALNGNPHIILLMIGTNDLFARDTANMAARLDVLLDDIAENAPNALIVLAQITPLGSSNSAVTANNTAIPELIQAHAAEGQHMIGVDMSKLPTSNLSDGTHPNDQGYAYMADIWYAAIKELLPK
jgi:hypothetical protein